MKTWLHRISHHAEVSYPLLERGYLSIGFSDFVDEAFLKGVADGGRDYFDRAFEERWGFRARTRHNLWNFIVEMSLGDRIIVPSDGVFSVYRITGDRALRISEIDASGLQTWGGHDVIHVLQGYLRDAATQNDIDLGFARTVAPIETAIPRSGYADAALTSRMKIRLTTANISDLDSSVDEAVASFRQRRPINLHSKILAGRVPAPPWV